MSNKTGQAKLRSFIIGIVLVSLFVTTFGVYYANIGSEYGVNYDGNTSQTLDAYNQFTEIESVTQELNQTVLSTGVGESGATDIIGTFFGGAFGALKLSAKSFSAFFSIGTNAASAIGIPGYVVNILILVALITIIFIIISALIGKDV